MLFVKSHDSSNLQQALYYDYYIASTALTAPPEKKV